MKRQRKLDQVEIPEEHVSMTDELLGKGGFGEVYLADYNAHNAAVKVWTMLPNGVKCHKVDGKDWETSEIIMTSKTLFSPNKMRKYTV